MSTEMQLPQTDYLSLQGEDREISIRLAHIEDTADVGIDNLLQNVRQAERAETIAGLALHPTTSTRPSSLVGRFAYLDYTLSKNESAPRSCLSMSGYASRWFPPRSSMPVAHLRQVVSEESTHQAANNQPLANPTTAEPLPNANLSERFHGDTEDPWQLSRISRTAFVIANFTRNWFTKPRS